MQWKMGGSAISKELIVDLVHVCLALISFATHSTFNILIVLEVCGGIKFLSLS